jgi:hypothetical protein
MTQDKPWLSIVIEDKNGLKHVRWGSRDVVKFASMVDAGEFPLVTNCSRPEDALISWGKLTGSTKFSDVTCIMCMSRRRRYAKNDV